MPNTRKSETLSLDDIHQAIGSAINEREPTSVSLEDALQAIETIQRPKTVANVKELGTYLFSAIDAAGENPQNWKLLALTIIHGRYHAKAPAAKVLKKNDEGPRQEGHGERLSFYLFYVYLQIMARKDTSSKLFLGQACECLGRLALPAGGTRDICALLEHLVYDTLNVAGVLQIQKDQGNKRALSEAVMTIVLGKDTMKSKTSESSILEELLKIAAKLLDEDLTLIAEIETTSLTSTKELVGSQKKARKKQKMEASQDRTLQSTISTFIPHHDRGTKSRKLAQSVAELMIWSQTSSSKLDPKFSSAIQDLRQYSSLTPPPSDTSIDDKIIICVHSLQTSIRRLRKKLNSSSRDQGFSLCTSFTMDPASITLEMVKGGKEGDVQRLSALASKATNNVIVKLIANRYADCRKAVPMTSVNQLHSTWMDADCEGDELARLLLSIQYATVKATIDILRSKIPVHPTGTCGKSVIASLDSTVHCDGAAILIAAAFNSQCVWDGDKPDSVSDNGGDVTLYIGEELCSISTGSDVIKLLNQVFTKEKHATAIEAEGIEAATTKDVQNLIERHLEPGSQLILFASTDVKLEPQVLEKLQCEESTIHCHIDDEWSKRTEREKAKVGDITVTLLWDNQCDLDLHAICPNGDHISYMQTSGGGIEGGGYLDVDMNQSGESMEPVENIFFGDAEKGIEAAHGKYKIFVQNYQYHGKTVAAGEPVSWRVRLLKDGKKSEFNGTCIGMGSKSDSTVIEFNYSGRTAPLPEAVGSALVSSNLIGVTSSSGSTIDSLSGLMRLREQNEVINQVQNLISTGEDEKIEDTAMDTGTFANAEDEKTEDTTTDTGAFSLMANQKTFSITNRERLFLNLSTLPSSFHAEVNQSFQGGGTLLDYTASQLAKRLIKDGIHIDELRKAGYEDSLVGLVKDKMVTFGV